MLVLSFLTQTYEIPGSTDLSAVALAAYVALTGWISEKAYNGLKTIIPGFDQAAATVHMIGAPLLGLLLGYIAAAYGLPAVTGDAGTPVARGLLAVLNALLMAGIFRREKQVARVDATAVLDATREGSAPPTY